MASFLVVQGPYDYFAMSSKWTDAGGMNWHNQFDRFKCGEPLSSLPTIDGAVWTREFQNCSVRYDRSMAQCGSVSGASRPGTGSVNAAAPTMSTAQSTAHKRSAGWRRSATMTTPPVTTR